MRLFCDLSEIGFVGNNVIIGSTVRMRKPENTVIHEGSIIDDFTYISGTLYLGKFSHIGPNCNLIGATSEIRIGAFVGISAGCSIYAASADYMDATLDLPSVPEPLRFGGIREEVTIRDYCLLGCGTIVMPGVNLPEGVATAAGTILRNKTYEPWTLYEGHEGRPVAKRDHTELFRRLKHE